jgi:hypothetical protein
MQKSEKALKPEEIFVDEVLLHLENNYVEMVSQLLANKHKHG